MSTADAVAAVLWVGATLYAVFGGADFGAGFWALVAGGGERGERARALVDWAIGPVWEANHVWLIFVLVVLWTAFSVAFASIMSTLFIPLSLAALGIVLRGSGFAFHKMARRLRNRELAQRAFGLSSLLTPFFMGTVVGAIASGRVPVGNAAGDPVTSWLNAALAADRRAVRGHRRLPFGGVPGQRRPAGGGRGPGGLLLEPGAGRRSGLGSLGGRRDPRLSRRRPLHLRRAHPRGPAAGDPLRRSADWRC